MLKESVAPLLVEQYFDLLSTAYRQRNRLFSSYQHDYSHLVEWDKYIINYSQGLLLLSNESDDFIQDCISESVLNKGDFFAIALYALAIKRESYLHALLTLAYSITDYDEAVRDIILWAPEHASLWAILADYPLYHAYALTVRPDIGIRTEIHLRNLPAIKPSVLSVGFLASMHRCNHNVYFKMIEWLLRTNDEARIIAIESLLDTKAFYSCQSVVQDNLYQLTCSTNNSIAEKAAELAIFKSPLPVSEYLKFLAQSVSNHRLYIKALGWSGCAHAIPELIEHLDAPEFARLSAAALYTITGASPEKEGWAGDAPAPEQYAPAQDEDDFPAEDPDAGLAWPDKAEFVAWWGKHCRLFTPDKYYLAGKHVSDRNGIKSTLLTESLRLSCLAANRLSDVAPLLSVLMRMPAHAGIPHRLITL